MLLTCQDTFLEVSRPVRFSPPLPEPDVHLSAHPALQSLAAFSRLLVIEHRCISHHSLAPLPENLSPFPLYLAFPGSPVGRHSYEYYGDSVALGLSTGRRSRILVTFDVSALRACLSSNPLSRGPLTTGSVLLAHEPLACCGVTDSKGFPFPRYATVDGQLHRVGHRLGFRFAAGLASSLSLCAGLAGTTTVHTFPLPRF